MRSSTRRVLVRWLIVSLRKVGWAPTLVLAIHVSASVGSDIYRWFPEFDIAMHFAGGMAIAYFLGGCYRVALRFQMLGIPSKALYPVTVFGLTSAAAVIWEFAEFLAGKFGGLHTQPSLADTLLDVLMGQVGGIAWLLLQIKRWP